MTEPEQTVDRAKQHGAPWYVWDVALLLGFVLLCMSLFGIPSLIEYRHALRNGYPSFLGSGLVFGGLALSLVIWVFVLAVRMLVSWPRHIRGSRRLGLRFATAVAGIGLCLVLSFRIWPPGYETFSKGFRKYVQVRADVPAIRAWLSTLDPIDCTGERMHLPYDFRTRTSDWPDGIRWPAALTCLDPSDVTLSLDETGHPMIRLGWGGSLAYYGFVVGSEKMNIPKTQPRTKQESIGGGVFYEPGEYRLPFAPGAYAWREIR